ncbi:MAG: YbfB/YjiJ family MFS transporter [Chloroflexi bacterium]|nr:YbfB/YjiJ family MFS transporter [Chloroflexota bacterium]
MILPSMQDGLVLTYSHMGTLGAINLTAYTVFSLVGGMLATRFGSKIIITVSMLLVGLSMALMGIVSSFYIDLVLMVLAGVGTAGVFVPVAGLVRVWAHPRRQALFLSLTSAGVGLGMIIAAFLVPTILLASGRSGWRHAWIYLGTATVATSILAAFLKEKLHQRPLSARPSGNSSSDKPVDPPIPWQDVFRNPTILGLSVVYFLFGFYQIYATFFVAYLTKGLSLPVALVGNIWFYWAVLSFFFVMFWSALSDSIGRKKAVTPCLLLLVASTLLPIFRQDVISSYISAMLFGATFVGPMIIILAAAGDAVDSALASTAVGLVTAVFGLGQTVSPALAGVLIDATSSFYPGFLLAGAIITLSLISLLLIPLRQVGPR